MTCERCQKTLLPRERLAHTNDGATVVHRKCEKEEKTK